MGIMARVDVVDDAIIGGTPQVVSRAIMDEVQGITHWWMPYYESTPRGEGPHDKEGATFDVTIHGKHPTRFSSRITKIVESKSVEVKLTGDFEGTGEWTFEPVDGKTRVRYRWNVKPRRLLLVLLSPFYDYGKIHSNVMHKGFEALNAYLNKKSQIQSTASDDER